MYTRISDFHFATSMVSPFSGLRTGNTELKQCTFEFRSTNTKLKVGSTGRSASQDI